MATFVASNAGRWTDPQTWCVAKNSYRNQLGSWTLTAVTIDSDSAVDPFSEIAGIAAPYADRIVETAVTSAHRVRAAGFTWTDSETLTYVGFFKKWVGRDWIYLETLNKAGETVRAWFDINSGVLGSYTDSGTSFVSRSITDERNGCWRCEIKVLAKTGAGTPYIYSGIADADLSSIYAGDITKGVYAFGLTAWEGTQLYPGEADTNDTASSGYVVIYDSTSTNKLGPVNTTVTNVVTNTGVLYFPRYKSTVMVFNHLKYLYNNGGTIDCGTDADPIPAGITHRIEAATTGAYAQAAAYMIRTNSSIGSSFVGADLVGGVRNTYLSTATVGGATSIKVKANVAGKWLNGQKLVVMRGGANTGAAGNSDGCYVSINGDPTWDGVESTVPITALSGAGTVPYVVGGFVHNPSYTIKLGFYGDAYPYTWNLSTLAPNVFYNQLGTFTVKKVEIYRAQLAGVSLAGYIDTPVIVDDISQLNGLTAVGYASIYCTISNSMFMATNTYNTAAYGAVFSNCYFVASSPLGTSGLNSGYGVSFVSCVFISGVGISSYLSEGARYSLCRFYGQQYLGPSGGVTNGTSRFADCIFGKNEAGVFVGLPLLGMMGVAYGTGGASGLYILERPDLGGAAFTESRQAGATTVQYLPWMGKGRIVVFGADGDPDNHYLMLFAGTVTRTTSVLRSGGADTSMNLLPSGYGAINNNGLEGSTVFKWTESGVPESSQTRSIYISQPDGVTLPLVTELFLEATYNSSPTTRAIITSTAVLTNNNWTEFTVTFVPGSVGPVEYRLLTKYTNTAQRVYIDATLYRLGMVPLRAGWFEGECRLDAQYVPTQSFGTVNGCSFVRRS